MADFAIPDCSQKIMFRVFLPGLAVVNLVPVSPTIAKIFKDTRDLDFSLSLLNEVRESATGLRLLWGVAFQIVFEHLKKIFHDRSKFVLIAAFGMVGKSGEIRCRMAKPGGNSVYTHPFLKVTIRNVYDLVCELNT